MPIGQVLRGGSLPQGLEVQPPLIAAGLPAPAQLLQVGQHLTQVANMADAVD